MACGEVEAGEDAFAVLEDVEAEGDGGLVVWTVVIVVVVGGVGVGGG